MDALLGVATGATAASTPAAPFVFPSVGLVCISSVTSTVSRPNSFTYSSTERLELSAAEVTSSNENSVPFNLNIIYYFFTGNK